MGRNVDTQLRGKQDLNSQHTKVITKPTILLEFIGMSDKWRVVRTYLEKHKDGVAMMLVSLKLV